VRKPTQRIDSLHFAKDTPYETMVKRGQAGKGEQVLNPQVARAVADAIHGVAQEGTAKRVKTAFVKQDGSVIAMGGKTGTGDQRFDVYGAGHRLIESRYVNRSATFVFNIGERFFGSMTAYVHGPESAHYDFTSALPVQLLVTLAPSLMPMVEKQDTVTVPGLHVERAGVPAPAGPADAVATDTEQAAPADTSATELAPAEPPAAPKAAPKATAPATPAATPPKPADEAAHHAKPAASRPTLDSAPNPKPAATKPVKAAESHPKAVDAAARPKAMGGEGTRPKAPRKPGADENRDAPPVPRPKPAAVEEVLH
jgi:membrane peptidoglycan carboxypeptidase